MLVSNLKKGGMYRPKYGCMWYHHSGSRIKNYISVMKLDDIYQNSITIRPVAMYLGISKIPAALPNGSKKGHTFLANGKKIILNNYSIRNLENIHEPSF